MIIKNLKVNGFGKLENQDFKFNNGINVVEGNNESGKSTLLKFIASMFYGVSKNKNGKLIPDYDRYKPWRDIPFSGKIQYTLDSGEDFEVYRDFKKKTPIIYNAKKEDITNNYKLNKAKDSLFFVEQTGIEENDFCSTCITEQENVKLSDSDKNQVIQRLSNILSTGDENTSYKKVVDRLNKMQLENVGSSRSTGRPINQVEEAIEELEEQRKDAEEYEKQKYEVDRKKQTIKTDIEDTKIVLSLLRKQKGILEKTIFEEEKLKILKKNLSQNNDEQDILEERLNDLLEERKDNLNKSKIGYILGALIMIIVIAITIILRKPLILLGLIVSLIIFVIQALINRKKTNRIKRFGRKIQKERVELEDRLTILEKSHEKQEKEILDKEKEILTVQKEAEKEVAREFAGKIDDSIIEDILSTEYSKIVEFIDEKEREQAEISINERKIEIDNENIVTKLEDLVDIDEKLEGLYERKDDLLQLNNMYEMAKEEIEKAYQEMKDNITPEFLEELKTILSGVTNGKYSDCYIDSDNNILVEIETGQYVPIELLSIGTIDLVYMALRISAAKEISKETMPIILDEGFAYYDNDRMARILKYLASLDRQVIIFTCSNREKEILKSEKIYFNLIDLNIT